tara:strand:- start:646 stop:885 length:240 start_codon:yes stop_codon:yes gene_type:complete
MIRNILLSLSLIGFCGCSHNPEINTTKQVSTSVSLNTANKLSFEQMAYVAEKPIKCYHWIPLEYTKDTKEVDIDKNKNK